MSTDQIKQRVKEQFGGAGDAYVVSATHREGNDLQRLVEWAELSPDVDALDIATGGGHTALALAPHVRHVTVSDLTPEMLQHAEAYLTREGVTNADYQIADAEDLPFDAAAFDVVTCRIAPHHFPNVERFVQEVARVLRPGGRFMLIDTVVPEEAELAEFANTLDKRRDPSHVRSHSLSEWTRYLNDAGLDVEATEIFTKRHPYDEWTSRSRMTPEERDALTAWLLASPAASKERFLVEEDAGQVIAFTDEKALFKARKR